MGERRVGGASELGTLETSEGVSGFLCWGSLGAPLCFLRDLVRF